MERERISVVIPAYNAEKTLEAAVRSVLRQTWRELEILVIDDCSRDGTWSLLQKLAEEDERIRPFRNASNQGVSYSRNFGVANAGGDWIAFLDSDDLWQPEKLEKQMALAKEYPETSLFFTGSSFIDENDRKYSYIFQVPEKVDYRRLLGQNVISCSSVLARREVMCRFPMGNDAIHEDFAVWLRVLREEPWARAVPEPLLIYRVSRNSKSGNKLKAARMTFATYRYVHVPFFRILWSGMLYTIRGIRKFRAIGASLTEEKLILPENQGTENV